MSTDLIDLMRLGERLASVRRMYGDSIDLPNLGAALFAMLLGVAAVTYQAYEFGETEPTVDFLVALRKKTGVSLDWLLDPRQQAGCCEKPQ
jgi:transcriptional regulator with XRE-family HTH domain